MFQIKLLAECPEAIPALAKLWLQEIGNPWIPGANLADAEQNFHQHANQSALPMTFVALHSSEPIGMCSLRRDDGLGEQLTPWLGSLIVHPAYQKKGIGTTLINVVKQFAANLGFSKLFLMAFDPKIADWYERLGWERIGEDELFKQPVKLMATSL